MTPPRDGQRPLQHLTAVLGDADVDLLGRRRAGLGIDLAVVAEAEEPALGPGQEADRVLGEIGHGRRGRRLAERALIDVEGAALLAQIIEIVAVRVEDRIAVLALERRQHSVLLRLQIVDPDVAGHGRGVVLAPLALVALLVVVDDLAAGRIDRGRDGRLGHDEGRLAAGDRDAVELRKGAHGELDVGRRVLTRRAEEDALVVRRKAAGEVGRGVIGQAPGLPAHRPA